MIKKIYSKTNIQYGNRGMDLESDINITNKYYLDNNIAVIYKKPTPIKIIKVVYPQNMIKEAYFESPSTLDYNGIYKGRYLDFDVKETKSKTSFPLSNIHPHQLEHMRRVLEHQGITFLIVSFVTLDEIYLIKGEILLEEIKNNNRKSIPISVFREKCFKIKVKYSPRIDYLKVLDEVLSNEKETKNSI